MAALKYIADIIDNKNGKKNFYKIYLNNSYCHAYNLIINNSNLLEQDIETILNYFNKVKKIYNIFSYLVRLYRWKKYKHSSVDVDLCGDSLDTLPEIHKIQLIQNKTIYTFRISDLLNIWKNALTTSIYLNPIPKLPKNPYTNIKFTIADLVNIFIKTKKTNFTVPLPIEIFWRCLMNINKFKFEGYDVLKEYAIINYINNYDDVQTFYIDIVNMINSLTCELNNIRISVNHSFENKVIIVNTLKPFLKYYLLSKNTGNPLKKTFYFKQTIRKLKNFFKDNPTFGRIFVSTNRTNQVVQNRSRNIQQTTRRNTILYRLSNTLLSNSLYPDSDTDDIDNYSEIDNTSDTSNSSNNYYEYNDFNNLVNDDSDD